MAGLSTNAPGLWGGFAGLLYGSTSLSTPPGFLADAPPAWVPDGGVLAFEFDNGLGYNSRNLATTTPDSILTYTNPSTKMVYGSDGVLRYAPHNLLLHSDNTTNAVWTGTGVSILVDAADDVLFVHNGVNITVSALGYFTAGSAASLRQQYTSLPAGKYVFSAVVKKRDYDAIQLRIGTIAGLNTTIDNQFGLVDLRDGSIPVDAGNVATVADLGNGYYRIGLPFTLASTTTVFLGYWVWHSSSVTADGTKGYLIQSAQLAIAPAHTGYVKTTTAAVYSLPIDHNPTTFEPLGVLIEEQRTNLLTYSEQFDNAGWTKGNLTVTANAVTAPDGTTTADKLVEAATTATHNASQTVTIVSATVYTQSVYAKAGERNWLCLEGGSGAGSYSVWFNLSTGVVGTVAGTTAGNCVITDVGNGWYRCAVTDTSTTTTGIYRHFVCDADNNQSYTGDGTSGLYVWGAQLEAGAFATSYIPTVASQVTRAADQVSVPTSAFAYNASEGTLYTDGRITSGGTAYFGGFSDNGGSDLEFMGNRKSGATYSSVAVDGGVTQASLTGGSYAAGAEVAIAFAYKANDFANSIDGATVATDASGTLPTVTGLYVGAIRSALGYSNGPIKRLTYFPTRKTNAELQALSA